MSWIALLDIQIADGTIFHWSDWQGSFATVLGSSPANYEPRIKSVGPLSTSRDQSTDAGDVTVENVGGNSVERDVATALRDRELAGALAVLRIYDNGTEEVLIEVHGYFADPDVTETEVTLRLRQLGDPNRLNVPDRDYCEQCDVPVYKGVECGSTSSEAACDRTYANCTVRGVAHHFPGIVTLPPGTSNQAQGF